MSITSPKRRHLSFLLLFSTFFLHSFPPPVHADNYFWDTDPYEGYQAGNGIWSTREAMWTTDGITLSDWPGAGNTATFTGKNGAYTISVNHIQDVDSIYFGCNGYTLQDGEINFGIHPAITVNAGVAATITTDITGQNGLLLKGCATSSELILSGNNSYTGVTQVGPNIRLNIVSLTDGGSPCAIGAASNSVSNLVLNGGKLRFIGSETATDRLFSITAAKGNAVYSSGNGALKFTNPGVIICSAPQGCELEFGGTYGGANLFAPRLEDGTGGVTSVVLTGLNNNAWIFTGDNTYTGGTTIGNGVLQIGNNGSTGSVVGDIINYSVLRFNRADTYTHQGAIRGTGTVIQSGSGTLVLTANNDYSGQTILTKGTLLIAGVIESSSMVTVLKGATLGGNGTCKGTVSVDDAGVIAPGMSEPGTLSIDQLELNPGSILEIDINSHNNDILLLTGTKSHTLKGKINVKMSGTVSTGTYRIINFEGTLSEETPSCTIGAIPEGCRCSLNFGQHYVDLNITRTQTGIIHQTTDTVIVPGDTAIFSVMIDNKDYPCAWIKIGAPIDTLSRNTQLMVPGVTLKDSGTSFICFVRTNEGTLISDTMTVRVVLPASLTRQPVSQSAYINETVGFTVAATGSPPLSYRWYKVDGDNVLPVASSPLLVIENAAFEDSGSYYCIVYNIGGSDTSRIARLTVHERLSGTSFHLIADAIDSTSILLSWNNLDTTELTTIRLLYSRATIDTGAFIPNDEVDSMLLPATHTSMTISELIPGTQYCFVIQCASDTDWSTITEDSRTFCETPTVGTVINSANSVVIKTLIFDSLTATIRISWCVDPMILTSNTKLGITYGLSNYPTADKGWHVIDLVEICTDTILHFNPMIFDTLYYVTLWLRTDAGTWFVPSASASSSVRTTHTSRQIITLFDTAVVNDTISAFDGSVIFWNESGQRGTPQLVDTVERIGFTAVPQGMIVVGKPFRFTDTMSLTSFNIGMRIDSLPQARSIDDVYIYTDSAGKFLVNYATVADHEHSIVYVKTADLRWPFAAMIDTVRPTIEFYSDTGAGVSTANLCDSFSITDNIANVTWEYLYGRGDETTLYRYCSNSYRTGNRVSLAIADTMNTINSLSGLRILMVVNDGGNSDTINMSRSVIRVESDKLTIEANAWTPVYPTAELRYRSGDFLVSRLFNGDGAYDTRYMRLYRWVNYEGNSLHTEKWVEYDPNNEKVYSLFTLEPGRVFWVKTRERTSMHLDSGYTLSLKDTFTVKLPPKQWTDFGMPYRFGIRIQAVLLATGSSGDSIQFYQWKRDTISNLYSLIPLFVPGMADKINRMKTIDYLPDGGYSFYNVSSKDVSLRIPPTLPALAKDQVTVDREDQSAWSAKFVAQTDDSSSLPEVYFGYAPGKTASAYPVAPSFSPLRLSVFDRTTSEYYGHYISSDAKDGLVKELHLSNRTDSLQRVQYHFKRVGAFPEMYTAFCFDAALKQHDTCGTISIAPKSTVSRWIIVGTRVLQQQFITSVMARQIELYPIYPNPARSVVNIRYTVPYWTAGRVRLAIYTILGKKVWEKSITHFLNNERYLVTWNRRDVHGTTVGSGLYLVRFTVEDDTGVPVARCERRITLLR